MFFQPHTQITNDDYYQDEDGNIYAFDTGEMAGIGSFFKKLGKGLLKVAPIGLSFIPGIGGLSSALTQKIAGAGVDAANALTSGGGGGGGKAPDLGNYPSAVQEYLDGVDGLIARVQAGTLPVAEALSSAQNSGKSLIAGLSSKPGAEPLLEALAQKVGELKNALPTPAPPPQQTPQSNGANVVTLPNGQLAQPQIGANGQVVYVPIQPAESGIDTTTLLFFGGIGLAAILLLRK